MKTCTQCSEAKAVSDFYANCRKCKECTKANVRANRRKRIDYYRAYDRERGNRRDAENLRRYRQENPEKYAAHVAVRNAVRDGRLCKVDSCSHCGKRVGIHGHHDDYSKPLDVVWLCAACHHARHAELRESAPMTVEDNP